MPVDIKLVKQELSRYPRDIKKYPRLVMKKLEVVASPGIKSLTFKGLMEGSSGTDYLSYVQFFDVPFSDTKLDDTYTESTSVDGKVKYYPKPDINDNLVKLKCSCSDFRFKFEKELYDNSGLIGNWRRYTRKTPPPPVGYPHANPLGVMGFCKHVWSLLLALKSNNRIK